MPMMWGYYAGGGMAWWMILSSVFWLGLAALAVWALFRWAGSATHSTPPQTPQTPQTPPVHQSAIDILNERYARGEMDTAAYESIRERLATPVPESASSSKQPETLPSGR